MRSFLLLLIFMGAAFAQMSLKPTLPDKPTQLKDLSRKENALSLPKEGDIAFAAYERGYFLTAFKLALERVEKGKDAPAMTLLAELYGGGYGVPQNINEAHKWYKLAFEAGDVQAGYNLGFYALNGLAQQKNREVAFSYFETAAKKGHLAAQYNLTLLLLERKKEKEAVEYLNKCANGGLADCQYMLSTFYKDGISVEESPEKRAFWLQKAAEQGLTEAEIDYAVVLYNGRGTLVDEELGFKYLKKAAFKGNPVAQNRYARALAAGKGAPRNPEKAASWHALASMQGLQDGWLDSVVAKLSAEARSKSNLEALQWYKSSPK
jgi:uncharacterized protein